MARVRLREGEVHPADRSRRYSIHLLDGFQLKERSERVLLTPSGQRVVAYLSMNRHPSNRSALAESLWADHSPAKAAGNLRSLICRINERAPGLVTSVGRCLSVRANSIVDIDAVDDTLHLLRIGDFAQAAEDLETIASELLPGWYDDWVVIERERLRQRCLHGLEAMARALLESGAIVEAIDAALAAAAMEPLRETARRIIIRCHIAEGNLAEAGGEYRRFCRLIGQQMGLEPTPALTDLLPETLR